MEAIVARYGSSDDDLSCGEDDGDRKRLAGGGEIATTTVPTKETTDANYPSSLPRSRSFPHVEGNYAVHVYVPVYLSRQQAQRAIELVSRVNSKLQSSALSSSSPALVLNLDGRLDLTSSSSSTTTPTLHLSLSRCAPLTRPQWHSFLEALRTCLTAEESEFASGAISLRGLAALANEQRATTFLALGDQGASSPSHPSSSEAACALVRAVDAAAALSGMPPLRQPHKGEFVPHVSLGWVPGDEAAAVGAAAAASLKEEKREREQKGGEGGILRELLVPIERVICRVGKREHVVWPAR